MSPKDLVTVRGGALTDRWNCTWPFARLRFSSSRLALSVFGVESEIERSKVVGIFRYAGSFSKGIRIMHQSQSVPELLVFWHPHQGELLEQFQ